MVAGHDPPVADRDGNEKIRTRRWLIKTCKRLILIRHPLAVTTPLPVKTSDLLMTISHWLIVTRHLLTMARHWLIMTRHQKVRTSYWRSRPATR